MVKAFQKLETFAVQDFQWFGDGAPRRHRAAGDDLVRTQRHRARRRFSMRAIMAMKKVVEPMFEAKNDYDIFAAIAKRLGKEKVPRRTEWEMDWIKSFYDAALSQAKAKKVEMPDFDTFWKGAGVVKFPISAEAKSFVRHAKFREDPLLNPLGTPTGRIEIYSKNIEKMAYDDCPAHPTWMEPVERLDGPNTKAPLHLHGAPARPPALAAVRHRAARRLRRRRP